MLRSPTQTTIMPNDIICGKLDNRSDLGSISIHATKKYRLRGRDITKIRQTATLPVSVEKSSAWFNGRTWELNAFLAMAASKGVHRLCVLTSREYLEIVVPASGYGIQIDVLETKFPIFPDIKFNPSLRANYDVLTKHLRKLDQLRIRSSSLSKHLSRHHLRAVLKKIRHKNDYDRNFLFAFKDGYQEVFKLKENRPDRAIIALDFNSMYLECMKGKFCNPASIEYKSFLGQPIDSKNLANGLYRVRLMGAQQSFLLDHHPFRYKRLGKSYFFQLSYGDNIETLLHKDEVEYYVDFFDSIEIIEGLYSEDTIEHPLLRTGLNLYSQRIYHRRRGDRVKENLCKASIQHMHSATNQNRFSKQSFESMGKVREFLSTEFSMNLDSISSEKVIDFLTRHKYFGLTPTPQGYQLSYLDAGASDTLFSLSSQVVAAARLKMVKTIERLINHKGVELCYINIDSIHISIQRDAIDEFFKSNHDLISDQLGAMKVEAIADQGYWFDVGRYWLKKNNEVVLFKNKGLNHKAANNPFVCRRKISSFVEAPTFSHLHTYIMKIENSFTYHKRLKHITTNESRYIRFGYDEIKDIDTANLTEAHEQMSSMEGKIELFQLISKKEQALNKDR
ncbi:hypothetical protein A3L25_026720 [Pseudomonas putida]|uniref:Uncharacterized protein n=1 Tax=Pseudomonas putida TaxID=303 RepID=A0AAP9N4R9_PSEPU|nr:hypothetical protein [Pseudomonas putida]QJQ12826.1 hypothetical protein A3L25_026720 [Pseudomonas putida]